MPEGIPGIVAKVALVLAVLLLLLLLAQRLFLGFMAQSPSDYAGTTPVFDMRSTLDGPLIASGAIYGPTGRVATRFTAEMTGTWDATGGTLAESFRFADGSTLERAWHLVPGPDGRFTATADDVVGTGTGEVSGSALVLRYRLRLPDSSREVDVSDWLYLAPDGVIVNRAQFRRFGILLGEIVGTIRPAAQ